MGLANTCVPVAGGETDATEGGSETTTSTGSTGVATTLPPPSGSGVTSSSASTVTTETTASSSSDTTTGSETSSADESSTGEVGACCDRSCSGLCGESTCNNQLVGKAIGAAEAIGVVIVGDDVVWSTGFGRTLQIANLAESRDEQLTAVPDGLITRIAADETHVYFLDYGSGRVRRVNVSTGGIDFLGEVESGEAQFGSIAVNETHVYFAMRGSSGVWRLGKDMTNGSPELIATVPSPFGVVLDDTFLFFVDSGANEVRRIAFSDMPADQVGTVVVGAAGVADIDVDGERLYFGAGGLLRGADKLGTDNDVVTYASAVGTIWDIDHDDTHVYFTAVSGDFVGRATLDMPGADFEMMAETDQPWGIAVGCREVFWAQNGTQELMMVGK